MPAKSLTHSSLIYLVAITCLAIGAFALLDAWLQAFPAASRALIHPDGGLATALLGLALLLSLHGCRRLASVAAAGQLATAAASPWLAADTSMPHAMALMFALLAIGLLLLGHRGSRSLGICRWLGRGLALVGGLFLLTGWLTGLPEALFTHYHTAGIAALVILFAGLSLAHLAQPNRPPSPLPAWRSIAAGALGALLSVGGWYLFSSQSLQRIDQGGEFAIAQSEATIQRTLAEHIRLMHRQVGRWEVLGRLPETPLWQHELESYLDDYPSLGFIALLDDSPATWRLESRHPGIDAAWLDDTLSHPILDGWLTASQHDRQERLSPLIPGPEGESRILLALPLTLPDHPDHWLLTSLDIPTLLGREIPHTGRYVIQLSQDDNLLFSSRPVNATHDLRPIGSTVLALPGEARWTLSAQLPRQQLVQSALLPSGLLLSGLLLTLLLMTSQELYRLSNERRRHLDNNHRALRKVLQQRDQFFTLSLELFCRVSLEGRFLQVNPAFQQQLGYAPEALIGHRYSELIMAEDHDLIAAAIQQLAQGERVTQLETRIIDAQGEVRWVEINADLGEEEVIYAVARDITQWKHRERQLRILERSVEASVNGVVIADARQPDTPIMYVNNAFEQITGYTREEVIGRNCRILQGDKTDPDSRQAIRQALLAHRKLHVTVLNYRKDGTPFWNDLYISPVHDEQGEVTHFIGVQSDISTQREYESKLAYHASHDALTGLPNRTLLEDRLEQSCQFARRHARSLAVLFLDLDEFKPINDSLGHELGDRILVEVARRLEQGVRPGDTVARFGGDEFVVLLPDLAHQDDVLIVVERLLDTIARPYRDDSGELRLTASIGIAMGEGEIRQPTRLIQQADLAMYKAKRQGRNTYQWYTRDLNHKVSERVALRNALQRAIDDQQFELHYQPQVHGVTGSILGFEALIRWCHPERGYISPIDFISLAEDTGQIIPISQWVLTTACRDNVYLNGLGLGDFVMAVNVSPMQFHRPNFLDGISQALEASRLSPSLLELELTEGVLMDGSGSAIDSLHALRKRGIQIAIDDFGTGFSSLSYLKQLPIDKIKIDRSFVREVISDHRDAAIVQGILSMASPLQLKVVAEGVETQAQLAYLKKHLCDAFQGYHFARPMPLAELEPFLREHQATQQLQQAHQHGDEGRQTLLLLDDEANILRALTRTLRRDGYRILTAETAQQAFELLATEEVQVIISDQRMPGMSGTEFLGQVTELYPQTLQIVLSGYTDLKTVTAAINEGAIYKFLTKPWDDDELRLVVQQAFRKAARRKVREQAHGHQDG